LGIAESENPVNMDGLDKRLKESDASAYPYHIIIKDKKIIKLQEQYMP